jgi:ferritin
MLSEKMEAALNKQVNAEMYSSNLYLAMSAWFDSINLPGAAHWMMAQAKEEMGHAMKIYGHIQERLGRATIGAVDAPPAEWEGPLAAFEAVFEHEQKVTASINDLVDLAAEENDKPAGIMLQWFVTEQVEEEASVDKVVQQLKLIGDKPQALFMLDSVLGRRE